MTQAANEKLAINVIYHAIKNKKISHGAPRDSQQMNASYHCHH